MYSKADVIKRLKLERHQLDNWTKAKYLPEPTEEESPGGTKGYTQAALEEIMLFSDQWEAGLRLDVASRKMKDRTAVRRVLMSLQVPTRDFGHLVAKLTQRESVRSICSYWGSLDLLVEMDTLDVCTFADVMEFRQEILRAYPNTTIPQNLDLTFITPSDRATQSVQFLWDTCGSTTLARILIRLNPAILGDISHGIDGLLGFCEVVDHLNSLRTREGVYNLQTEVIAGTWDVSVLVETASLDDLAKLVAGDLRDRQGPTRDITRTATFIASPKYYWRRGLTETPSSGKGSDPESSASINACIFVKTSHRKGIRTQVAKQLSNDEPHYIRRIAELSSSAGADLLIEAVVPGEHELATLVFSTIGALQIERDEPPAVDDTETLLLLKLDDHQPPFPNEHSDRLAYFLVSSPRATHQQAVEAIKALLPDDASVFPAFGLYDHIVVLTSGKLNIVWIDKIAEKIRGIPFVDRLDVLPVLETHSPTARQSYLSSA